MVEPVRPRILIIDDSIEHIKILISQLEDLYDVFFARSGEEGLRILPSARPDLILLDILMPGVNGFEVCTSIKEQKKWADVPLIFVSARDEDSDETRGLELGAIDYITKPFSPAIVRARIRNHLRLHQALKELEHLYSIALDANPITGLPGNNTIANHIKGKLATFAPYTVLYTDLDNFKPFNDRYGFARGDEVIQFTARILKESVEQIDESKRFIGHVGGDDFLLVIPSADCHLVTAETVRRFDREIIHFYNKQDTLNGCITSTNRQGQRQSFPIMSISIAGVDLSHKRYRTYLEVNDACAELKGKAKAMAGSTVCLDQRRE